MLFSVLTLFPELIEQTIQTSITGRALNAGLFQFQTINIRDFGIGEYGKVDDTLSGGGTGMLMLCQPIHDAWRAAAQTPLKIKSPNGSSMSGLSEDKAGASTRTLFLSPKGRLFDQAMVTELKEAEHLIFLCGHYEGVDQRVLDEIEAEEVSLGDYVLTGGELAAAVMMDAIIRQLPGVLPDEDAFRLESHYDGRLECRQYTKPRNWKGRSVPDVLLSGHHGQIEHWRKMDGLRETLLKRPDLFDQLELEDKTYAELMDFLNDHPL